MLAKLAAFGGTGKPSNAYWGDLALPWDGLGGGIDQLNFNTPDPYVLKEDKSPVEAYGSFLLPY